MRQPAGFRPSEQPPRRRGSATASDHQDVCLDPGFLAARPHHSNIPAAGCSFCRCLKNRWLYQVKQQRPARIFRARFLTPRWRPGWRHPPNRPATRRALAAKCGTYQRTDGADAGLIESAALHVWTSLDKLMVQGAALTCCLNQRLQHRKQQVGRRQNVQIMPNSTVLMPKRQNSLFRWKTGHFQA